MKTCDSVAFSNNNNSNNNNNNNNNNKLNFIIVSSILAGPRLLIDCKKSQLFLRKIFEIEHAEYCCGFNFKKFSKLHAVITIEKIEMPSCRENC